MEIKKNDLLSFARNLPASRPDASPNDKTAQVEQSPVSTDSLRSRVLRLQAEVADSQTSLSARQSQAAFLKTLNHEHNWQDEFKAFSQKLQSALPEKYPASLPEFAENLQQEIKQRKAEIMKKQVELENIFSSSMLAAFEDGQKLPEISKEGGEMARVFANLRSDAIRKLVQG